MPETIDELKKLSPQERIRRLKELEEERKKEIEQAEELIKETSLELAEAEEKRKIPIPQARATDLSSALTTAEERQLVATHHLLVSETAAGQAQTQAQTSSQPQQPKSLEDVTAGEALQAQQQAQQPHFQRPAYTTTGEQQKPAFTEYASASGQRVTGSAGISGPASPIEDKVTEFYRQRALASTEEADNIRQSYKAGAVTGGYEARKAEEQPRRSAQEFYSKGAP